MSILEEKSNKEPSAEEDQPKKTKLNKFLVLSFFMRVIKPWGWHIVGLLVINSLLAIDLSLRPYILKVILNKISTADHGALALQFLLKPVIFYILTFTITTIITRFYDRIWIIINPNLKKQIGLKIVESLMEHSHAMYQNNFAGSLANKINDIINGVCHILKIGIDQFFSQFMSLAVAIYAVWQVNPKFSIILILWVISFIGMSYKLSNKAHKLSSVAANAKSQVFGNIVDILINMMNVRLFDSKILEKNRLDQNMSAAVNAEQQRDWLFLKIYTFQGGSFILLQTICLWWLVVGLQEKTVTIGDFALILTINMSLVDYLWVYLKIIRESSEHFGNISQAMHIMDSKANIQDHNTTTDLIVTHGRITFKNVNFSYNNTTPLFKNQNIQIEPGQKIGLVGYSGSGKSTFVNLILRLFDVQNGRILIDNQNIRCVTQSSLRKAITMIPQDPPLFNRSLIDNISYNNPNVTKDEIITAAKKAHAHEFIMNLPDGYNTLVGERGIKLSGGQRQRIAIARAILKNAPILILDEATSQLDSLTEQQIQDSLIELMQSKTTITVAHRLSTLLNMDRILVFKHGNIIQDGTHQDLLNEDGLYKELWDTQVGDYLPDIREFDVVLESDDNIIVEPIAEHFAKAM